MSSINTLLRERYETKGKLANLENENALRKSLIHIAVHRLIAIKQLSDTETTATQASSGTLKKEKTNGRSVTPHAEELTSKHITDKNHEYELLLNKLKQQFSTKEKLQESKIEALKEKVEQLKSQVSSNPTPPEVSFPSLGGYTNPRLRGSLTKPNSFTSSLAFRGSSLPSLGSRGRMSNEEASILSPLHSKRMGISNGDKDNIIENKPAKGELFSLGGVNDLSDILGTNSRLSPKKDTSKDLAKSSPSISTGPSSAFVKNFNDSSESPSATPGVDFGTKLKKESSRANSETIEKGHETEKSKQDEDKAKDTDALIDPNGEVDAPDANSTSLLHSFSNNSEQTSASENDTFTSAQMTLSGRAASAKRENSGSPSKDDQANDKRKKKKRKIQILKSRASKVQVASSSIGRDVSGRQISKGMHLEDENINSLNYYHDDNFQDDSFSSPKKMNITLTAPGDVTTVTANNTSLQPSQKKKKNIFKIT